ncbi:MAG: hypothetical protein ACRDZ0_15590, partial [Acidimicrobiales bacterium]
MPLALCGWPLGHVRLGPASAGAATALLVWVAAVVPPGMARRRLHAPPTPATTPGVAGGLLRVVRADRRTVWRWTVTVIVAAVVVRVGWAAW